MKAAKWNIRADLGEAEVWLYDEIGENGWGDGIGAKAFIDELNAVDASTLTVRINSPGGDVFDGFAMYQALLRHQARVVVEVDALAASAASVIAMAGDEINMADTSLLMVHDPWTFAIGNSADLREQADLLDQVAGSIVAAYTRRDGVDADTIKSAMAAETWYTATEAREAGLVDNVTEAPASVAARIPMGRFRNAPTALLGTTAAPPKPASARQRIESARRALQLAGIDK